MWSRHDGHFVAGVLKTDTAIVLDRTGTTVATWAPARLPGAPDAQQLHPVDVCWVGSDCQHLAVQCGVGDQEHGIWPGVLFTLLKFVV